MKEETNYLNDIEDICTDTMDDIDIIESKEMPERKDDAIGRYMRDITHYPTLTKTAELAMFAKYHKRTTSVKEKDDIRNIILSANTSFVISIAQSISANLNNYNITEDLIGAGNIGLIEAFESFDYRKGFKFFTYAVWFIRRAINSYLYTDNIFVRPQNYTNIAPKVKGVEQYFTAKYGRKPSTDEIVEYLHDMYDITLKYKEDVEGTTMLSLDEAGFMDNSDMDNDIPLSEHAINNNSTNSYADDMDCEDLKHNINMSMEALSERERTIVTMSAGINGYFREYKDYEIAEEIGITTERVRQLRLGALKKLKHSYTAQISR